MTPFISSTLRFHSRALLRWVLMLVLFLSAPSVGAAQVATNITPTTIAPLDLGTNVDMVGSTTHITGGTRPGSGTNLFHSFDFFTLGTGDVAHFMNDMQLPTTNIFGRVIGGEVSTIDGTLRTNNPLNAADPMNFGAAHLWLVNPSGLLLGPNARIEVGGSVSMSTANYLRFEGTALFDMLSSPVSLGPLSVAPVAAFGFLGSAPPAPITVQGSMLQVPEGQALSLVGGDITVQGGFLEDGTIQSASFRAPGVQLNLASVASPGEVLAPSFQTSPNVNGTSFTTMGTVMIKEGVGLDVSGQADEFGNPIGNGNSGTVLVRGGKLVMDAGSTMLANVVGAVDGASPAIDIQVSQDVALANDSAILTRTFGPGRAGDVQLTAHTLTLENGALIHTGTLDGGGDGGDVVLNVGTVTLRAFSSIQTGSLGLTPGLGQGGDVTIQGLQGVGSAAESVTLFEGSGLMSQTFGSGDGGRIAITSKTLRMEGPGPTVNTSAAGVGRGGDIVLGVQHASLSGGATIITETLSADPNASTGGTVTLQGLEGTGSMAGSVTLTGLGSGIVSETFGTPRSGDVAVHAKTVSLTDGAVIQVGTPSTTAAGGSVTIDAGSVGISGGSHVSSQSSSLDAGQVTITANALTLDKGSIETNANGLGRGGDVVLSVGSVSLANGAAIDSGTSGTGRAGDVTMNVGNLTLANHAKITSSSGGTEADAGDAGNVTITASGTFTSDASTIVTSALNAKGGNIDVTAQNVALSNGTFMSASSASPQLPDGGGDAGNITIQSGSTVVLHNSAMTAEASQASGGQITITAPEMVRLTNSLITTSVAGSATDIAGANVTIDPQFVILQNSQILLQSFAGFGGNISITAGVFLVDPNSVVSSSGSQRFKVPNSPLGGSLSAMSQQFTSAAALLLADRCAADPSGQFSSFVQTGRDGVPQVPGALMPSPLSFLEPLTSGSLGSPSPNWAAARLGLAAVRVDDSTRFYSACRS